MDRFFLARKIAGKVLVDIPTPEEAKKFCLDKEPESLFSGKFPSNQLEVKAGKCAQIVKKQHPFYSKSEIVKAASELMREDDKVIEKLYRKIAHL